MLSIILPLSLRPEKEFQCLESILNQNCDREKFEIVIVIDQALKSAMENDDENVKFLEAADVTVVVEHDLENLKTSSETISRAPKPRAAII